MMEPEDLPFETEGPPGVRTAPRLKPRLSAREGEGPAARQARRNKRNGRDAQRTVARLVGARDIGTLGGIDLDGGWFWGEVKNTHGLPEWFKKGMQQLAMTRNRPAYLFVQLSRQGVPSQVYVIETLAQWIETRGTGSELP